MNNEIETMGQEQQPEEPQKLEITSEISEQLRGAAKWAKFLAIIAFVFTGLMVFAGFMMSIVFLVIPGKMASTMPFPPFLFGLIYLLIGAVYFLPILYLYRFSNSIGSALRLKNQKQLTNAFKNLKAHYRFIGIFTIVGFVLYVVLMVVLIFVGLFTGLASSFSGIPA